MATIPSSNRSINSTFWQKKIKNKISREKTESKDWRPRIRIKDQDWGFKRLIEHVPFFFPLPFFFNQSTSQMLISKHQDSSNSWNLTCCFSYSLSHSSVPSKLQLFFFFCIPIDSFILLISSSTSVTLSNLKNLTHGCSHATESLLSACTASHDFTCQLSSFCLQMNTIKEDDWSNSRLLKIKNLIIFNIKTKALMRRVSHSFQFCWTTRIKNLILLSQNDLG